MKTLIDRFVPIGIRASLPTWMKGPSRWLQREKAKKEKEYKILRRDMGRNHEQVTESLNSFNAVNYQYRNYVRNRQYQYESSMADRFFPAPKLFHSYIRRRKIGCPSVGLLRTADGEVKSTASEMSNLLANSFSAVFVTETLQNHQRFGGMLENILLSPVAVGGVLSKLDSSSAAGPMVCIRACCNVALSWPFYLLYVQSLDEGLLPSLWKTSIIVPLFKNEFRCNPLNYRPVSLTSVYCKSLERVIVS